MSSTSASFASSTAAKVALAVAVVFGAVANANAAPPRIVELSELNLSQPLPSNVCFKDSDKGSAISKLGFAMGARQQRSVIIGNQVVAADAKGNFQAGQVFTSNLIPVSSSNPRIFGEGYQIDSNAPSNAVATKYCIDAFQRTAFYNTDKNDGVPAIVNKGELGVALRNNDSAGAKVAMVALTDAGTLLVVNFDRYKKTGSVKLADGAGKNATDYYLADVGYSERLTADARKIIGLTNPNEVAALSFNPSR